MIANQNLIILSMISLALDEVKINKGLPESCSDFIDLVLQYGRRASITRDEVTAILNQPLRLLVESVIGNDPENGK